MGALSKNFSRHDFACPCGCDQDTVDAFLITVLQSAADYFARSYNETISVKITSGNRCVAHNMTIGGASNSQHLYGRAADHKIYRNGVQIPEREVYAFYDSEYGHEVSLGRYDNRTHVDTRTFGGKRWDNRTKK